MTSLVRIKGCGPPNRKIALNDNFKTSGLIRERLESESLLSQIEPIQPRRSLSAGLIVICALCLATVTAFAVLSLE
jgi:hypothetical protein